jgi:hypothetical protein
MSNGNQSVGFARILDLMFAYRRRWFSFIENIMLTGLLQYLAGHSHSWVFWLLWFVSAMFLIEPIARATIDGLRWVIDIVPWARIETLPRVITYPAIAVAGLTVPSALLMCQYTAFQIANVIATVANSHAALH